MATNKGFYTDLENAEKAIAQFRFYRKKKKQQIQSTVKKNARKIQTRAKKLVPINSGDTKKSIKYKLINDDMSATIGPRKPKGFKAHWIEFGTKTRTLKNGRNVGRMKAQPFMRPAFEQIKPLYLNELKRDLRDLD
jgi:HK97 gp10 family phage protein